MNPTNSSSILIINPSLSTNGTEMDYWSLCLTVLPLASALGNGLVIYSVLAYEKGKARNLPLFRKFGRWLFYVYCPSFGGQLLEWAANLGVSPILGLVLQFFYHFKVHKTNGHKNLSFESLIHFHILQFQDASYLIHRERCFEYPERNSFMKIFTLLK